MSADELVQILMDRIARAVAILDGAPDPATPEASRREAAAIQQANLLARTVLTEGSEPPQGRGRGLIDPVRD